MRLSLSAQQIALRGAHLAREESLYRTIEHATFEKKKDWDENGPTVIWEGTLRHPDLSKPYTVQVHYGPSYPFVRPNVYPVKPHIVNQRHQNPTAGRSAGPGALCLLPHAPDRWDVSLTCVDIIERTLRWLKAYEAGTLDDEFAPLEIELFFPAESKFDNPKALLVESLLGAFTGREGECILVPTGAADFAFFAPYQGTRRWTSWRRRCVASSVWLRRAGRWSPKICCWVSGSRWTESLSCPFRCLLPPL
jgi:hypothetical protein